MNKIYMTKRGHDGKTVVCSEKTRARGKVKSLVLAIAAVGSIMSTTPSFAATAVSSGGTTGNFGSGSIEGFYATGESTGDLALTSSGEAVAIGGDAIAIGTNATANSSKGSIALGGQAKAIGTKATVIGYNAQAIRNENNATRGVVVIGQDTLIRNVATVGQNRGAMAIGDNALAGFLTADGAAAGTPVSLNDADYATKSGGFTAGRLLYRAGVTDESGATVSGLVSNEATAIGLDSRAIGDQSIAIGAQVVAGHASVSIGGNDLGAVNNGTNKTIYKDIAGTDLASNNINSVTGAPGGDWFDTTYAKDGSTAIGIKAHSNELFGTALGTSAFVQSGAELGTAIGTGARVGSQSENLDANLTASPAFTTKGGVAIAAGAVAERDYTTAIGTGSKAIQISATATGYKAVASAQNATAMGSQATASANDTIALGTLSSASGLQSIAIGKETVVTGVRSIAVGKGHIVEADNAGVFGDPSYLNADADGSYAIGNNNTVSSANTFVLGSGIGRSSTDLAVESGEGTVANSVYLGNESEVTRGQGAVALDGVGALKTIDKDQRTGAAATTAGASGTVSTAKVGGITYGTASIGGQAFAGATSDGAVSVGSSGAERRIQNVAAGEISKTSTDAINGSQLYAVAHQASKPITFKANSNNDNENVTMNYASLNGLERILGDEIVIKGANGNIPNFSRNTDAATAGAYSARNVQTVVDDQGLQIQIAANPIFDSVQFGSKEGPKITNDGANIKVGDSTGVPTKITNVAPGTSPNDAVNLSQLSANRTSVAPGDNTHVKTSDLAGGGTTYTVHADKAVVSQGDGVTITPDVATDPAKGTVTTTYNVALSQDTKNKLDRVETVIAGDSGLVTVTSPNNNNTGGKEFKVDITKGTFAPVSSTGALAAPTTDGVATVSDVVTAVNSGYWTANVDDTTKVADVKFGDSLNFVDGTATDAVVKNGGVSFNVKTDGNTIIVDDATNSLKVNTDALPKTVVAQGNNTVVSSSISGTTTTYTVDAEKTTVSKAATSPITVTEGAKSATGVTNYEVGLSIDESTLEVVDGKLTAKVVDTDTNTDKSVRVAGSDLVTVTNTAGAADGITTMTDYTVSINKGSFGATTDGSIITGTDGVATVGDVMTAVNAGYWTANVAGAKLADVKFGDTVSFVDGNGTKAVVKNGGVAYDINVKSSDNSIITKPNTDGSVDLTVNSSMIPSTVVDAGKGVTVTPVTNGNTTTYTIAVDDTIADKQYVADEIAKIPVVTDTDTDKSVRVNGSELVTVTSTAGAADGITTMTDYTVTLSDKVATKDFVAEEIAKIPTVVDTNTISEVEQGDGITVNAVTKGDKTTYTVALDDATKAQLAKEESVVAKAGEANIVVTQPRTNDTGGKEYEISLAKDLTGIDSIGKDGSKFTFNGDSISAGNVNITDVKSPVNATDAANKQYVDDAIAKIPAVVDTNTDKSVRVKSDSSLLTVTSKAGEADGITQMTDYTISLSDKVATTDYVDGEIAKIPTIKAGDNIAVKQDTVDDKPVVVVSADKSTVSQGDGIAVTVTETPTANGAVNRDYKVSLDDATKAQLAKVEKGINTKAEDGKVTKHQLGDTISVVGDNKNITTATTNDGAISVKMADDIKVNSVSINNTGITMGGNGIHAGDMKVTGVADGAISPSSTDAVNGSQLYATNMQVAQNAQDIRNLGDQLGDMRDEYRAGIADAAAVAGLPEIHLAGKSMFAVAGSTFKGESALAVGYSRLSDNSMMKFKASGSVNTQGDVLGTVGVGWAW